MRWFAICGPVVLDINPRSVGEDSLADLERQHGALPKTIQSLMGGGYHFFFQHPGGSIKSKPLLKGVDVKANGGYVVVPPGTHRSGERYRWNSSSSPDGATLTTLPVWLHAQLMPKVEYLPKPSAGTFHEKIRQCQHN